MQAGLDRGDEAIRGVLVVESDLVLVGDGRGVKDHVDRVPARRPLDRTFGPEVSVRLQSVEQPHLDSQFLAGDPAGTRLQALALVQSSSWPEPDPRLDRPPREQHARLVLLGHTVDVKFSITHVVVLHELVERQLRNRRRSSWKRPNVEKSVAR